MKVTVKSLIELLTRKFQMIVSAAADSAEVATYQAEFVVLVWSHVKSIDANAQVICDDDLNYVIQTERDLSEVRATWSACDEFVFNDRGHPHFYVLAREESEDDGYIKLVRIVQVKD